MKTLLLAITLTLLPAYALGQDNPYDEVQDWSLVGIKSIGLLVKVGGTPASDELTLPALTDRITRRLQRAGLTVTKLTEEKPRTVDGVLSVFVGSYGQDENALFNVELSLEQRVLVRRDQKIDIPAQTWNRRQMSIGGPLAQKDKVDLFVEQFVSAWQAVNKLTN